jgi:hypothetical protein
MPIQGTKLITVHAVKVKEGSLFSSGLGFDNEGNATEFIDHTQTIKNIQSGLEDFEDNITDGRPTIWLKPWQWEDTK